MISCFFMICLPKALFSVLNTVLKENQRVKCFAWASIVAGGEVAQVQTVFNYCSSPHKPRRGWRGFCSESSERLLHRLRRFAMTNRFSIFIFHFLCAKIFIAPLTCLWP